MRSCLYPLWTILSIHTVTSRQQYRVNLLLLPYQVRSSLLASFTRVASASIFDGELGAVHSSLSSELISATAVPRMSG